ncbi:MAG: serine/threonine-protein kinase [Polyangiaceae bacterium]
MVRSSAQGALAAGQCIGPFVLLEPLGSGGSGRVWAAVRVGQLGFTKRMALKLLRQDKLGNPRATQRFDREAQLGARLTHPNIRAVHDLNSHEGRPYMAMRWVDTSLEELLEHAPGHALAPEVSCWVGLQCCAALAAAHAHVDTLGAARPIIHRDVAPGNILLSAEGHVLLSDLAAPVDEESGSLGTSDTRFFGNLAYASPEALNQQELDGRADVYSLGCVLYQCLCGALPFAADNEHSLMYRVLTQEVVELHERAPHVPVALAAVVRRAMAREREDRFESAEAMGSALSACVESLGAFALEERTTQVIRELLGERLRVREEAMHAAFQRHTLSQGGQTETLPIRPYEGSAQGGDTRGSVALPTPAGGMVAPVLPARTRGRRAGMALSLVMLMGVLLYLRECSPGTPSATLNTPAPPAPALAREQSEALHLEPPPKEAPAPPPTQAPAPGLSGAAPAELRSSEEATAKRARKPERERPAKPAQAPAKEASLDVAAPTTSAKLQLERKNPYKNRIKSASPAAPGDEAKGSPPSIAAPTPPTP